MSRGGLLRGGHNRVGSHVPDVSRCDLIVTKSGLFTPLGGFWCSRKGLGNLIGCLTVDIEKVHFIPGNSTKEHGSFLVALAGKHVQNAGKNGLIARNTR